MLAGLFILSACNLSSLTIIDKSTAGPEIFIPPTLINEGGATPTSISSATFLPTRLVLTPRVTPTTSCTNNLTFESDLTIPDGTTVIPGSSLDKRWQVQNSGTCNWYETYSVRLIDGDGLGLSSDQPLYPARAGSELSLRLVFTAPSEPGTYRSAWQAFNPDSNAFGDPIFIEIVVK